MYWIHYVDFKESEYKYFLFNINHDYSYFKDLKTVESVIFPECIHIKLHCGETRDFEWYVPRENGVASSRLVHVFLCILASALFYTFRDIAYHMPISIPDTLVPHFHYTDQ